MRDGSLRRGTDRVEDALAWLLTASGMIVLIGAVTVGVGVYTQSMDRSGPIRSGTGHGRVARGRLGQSGGPGVGGPLRSSAGPVDGFGRPAARG